MSNNTVTDKILAIVMPIVSDLKLDLYDLEWNGGILKITVDTPAGSDGGITLDQLSLVTRLIGRDFDHADPIPGHYTLEVSSPGLERNLRTAAHFQREIGKTVNIRLRANVDGMRRIQGVLIAADDTTATVALGDAALGDAALNERVVAIEMIDRAKTVFQWEKGEKISQKPGSPTKKTAPKQAAATKKNAPKNSPKRSKVAAGGVKPAPGPSDELDPDLDFAGDRDSGTDLSIEQEATA